MGRPDASLLTSTRAMRGSIASGTEIVNPGAEWAADVVVPVLVPLVAATQGRKNTTAIAISVHLIMG